MTAPFARGADAPGPAEGPGGAPLAAVSVDLDETPLYASLHGLRPSLPFDRHAVYGRALPRIFAWAEARGLPLTLFVVGADLARGDNVSALAPFVRRGDEIGNHSLDHPYALTRLPARALERQVRGASDRIGEALGVRAEGFRAPGYAVDERLLGEVARAGLRYDSSVFPCPAYYAAKLAALASMRLAGRRSRAIVDHPRALLAPARPYRPGARYWARGAGPVVELPVGVAGRLRLPFIGTSLSLSPKPLFDRLVRGASRAGFVNLELHGIDFLDERDNLAEIGRFQPDLRAPVGRKLARFDLAIGALREAGGRFVRLCDAASLYEAAPL